MNEGEYLFLKAISNNNIEIIKLLIRYAIENDIILNINEKNKNGDYLLLSSIINNKMEMVQLLIDYANENNIF